LCKTNTAGKHLLMQDFVTNIVKLGVSACEDGNKQNTMTRYKWILCQTLCRILVNEFIRIYREL